MRERRRKRGGGTDEDLVHVCVCVPDILALRNAARFQCPAISIFASRSAESNIRRIVMYLKLNRAQVDAI